MKQENKKYALLEDGTVECLYYDDGGPRCFYKDEDGNWYLDHDVNSIVRNTEGSLFKISYKHSKIVKFGNSMEELL